MTSTGGAVGAPDATGGRADDKRCARVSVRSEPDRLRERAVNVRPHRPARRASESNHASATFRRSADQRQRRGTAIHEGCGWQSARTAGPAAGRAGRPGPGGVRRGRGWARRSRRWRRARGSLLGEGRTTRRRTDGSEHLLGSVQDTQQPHCGHARIMSDAAIRTAGQRPRTELRHPTRGPSPSCFAVFVDQVPAAAQAARTARVSCGVACSGHGPRNLAAMMTRRSLTAMSS